MYRYIKLDDSELGNKTRYMLFLKGKRKKKKKDFIAYYKSIGKHIPDINLSDFEFFLECYPKPLFDEYIILDDNDDIIGHSIVDIDDDSIASIDIDIEEVYQGMGFGTKLVKFIEDDLLKRDDIKSIAIRDMSDYKQSSKIAEKLGYELIEPRYYEKINPNYKGSKKEL